MEVKIKYENMFVKFEFSNIDYKIKSDLTKICHLTLLENKKEEYKCADLIENWNKIIEQIENEKRKIKKMVEIIKIRKRNRTDIYKRQYNKGNKLYMRLSGANKYMSKKQWLFELDDYKEITFVEVLNIINKKYITNNPYSLGRHFYDALLYFYKENNLSLGYNKSILRDIDTKEINKSNFQYTLF